MGRNSSQTIERKYSVVIRIAAPAESGDIFPGTKDRTYDQLVFGEPLAPERIVEWLLITDLEFGYNILNLPCEVYDDQKKK